MTFHLVRDDKGTWNISVEIAQHLGGNRRDSDCEIPTVVIPMDTVAPLIQCGQMNLACIVLRKIYVAL